MEITDFTTAFVDRQLPDISKQTDELSAYRLAVKDLFDVVGIPTSAGNPDWLNTHAVPNDTNSTVFRLLQHGAKYVGKTLTDELAYSLNGQNVHYPKLVNPVTPERIAGGSSSGSAVAVASNQADIGLGTDTGGSIRVPASYNGLFGLRTTHDVISCDNMVALAPSFDTVGWLTRTLDEMESVARLVLPNATKRNQSNPVILTTVNNLIAGAEHKPLIEQWLNARQNVTLQSLEIDVVKLNTSETFRVLQGYEIWQQHGQWITANHPKFADDVQARFAWCKTITREQFLTAKTQQAVISQVVKQALLDCDALVIPTTPGKAPLLETSAEALATYRENLMALTALAGLAGLPQLHLPLFTMDGAPCGLSIIGKSDQDFALISVAKQLIKEQHE